MYAEKNEIYVQTITFVFFECCYRLSYLGEEKIKLLKKKYLINNFLSLQNKIILKICGNEDAKTYIV